MKLAAGCQFGFKKERKKERERERRWCEESNSACSGVCGCVCQVTVFFLKHFSSARPNFYEKPFYQTTTTANTKACMCMGVRVCEQKGGAIEHCALHGLCSFLPWR